LPRSSNRRYINLPNRRLALPFSDAVLAGDTLYLAGRIGFDPKTGRPAEDVDEEARLVLDGIRSVLAEAGMSMGDLVYVQIFCPDLALFDRFNAVYRSFFKQDLPARAFLGSGPLLFGARFEVQGIAVRRPASRKRAAVRGRGSRR
jgi:2-iminobutanoate/2-iminopropanoate deaminase